MEAQATAKYIRMSPRKVRLVIDMVRGLPVAKANHTLMLLNKKAAKPVAKLVKSAAANAVHNFEANEKDLFVKFITADEGPTLKRWRPRAFGRATLVRKRTTHITVVVSDGKETVAQSKQVAKKETAKPDVEKKEEKKAEKKEDKKAPAAKTETKKPAAKKSAAKKPAKKAEKKSDK